MALSEQDRPFMLRALDLAGTGRGCVEPNPMVGALIVRDGSVVGEGRHERFGGPHAEVFALQQAGEAARGATMYVTLEPCGHAGKTPPCAPVVAAAGLARVVTCTLDPTATAPGGGSAILEGAGVQVDVGVCRDEAARLNAGFFKLAALGRPLVIAKWAMSADGKAATGSGASRWISGAQARRLVHAVRGQVDCVIVGRRTVELDDPLLTCRDAERRRTAARLIVCGRGAPAEDARLVRTADQAPVLLAYPADHPPSGLDRLERLGCEPLAAPEDERAPGRVWLAGLLDLLGERRMTNVLVEGGSDLLGGFFDAGLVDRVMAFVAPLILGGRTAPAPVGGRGAAAVQDGPTLQGAEWRSVGPDTLLTGWVSDPPAWAP